MSLRRWRDSLAPPLLAVATTAAMAVPAAAGPPRLRSAEAPGPAVSAVALKACKRDADAAPGRPVPGGRPAPGAWYRLDPRTDEAGTLTGFRFVAGRAPQRGRVGLMLPVESFASGPLDGRVLLGADDGDRSSLRLVDVVRGCVTLLHEGRDLVRRAVLSPAGDAIIEFRLDRRTRTDLGVWWRPLDGSSPRRIVEPLAVNARLGRVFSTELRWSSDGRRLLVGSCGEAACLTRVDDPSTGVVRTVDDERIGEPIGIVGDELIAYGGCPALPCPVVAWNLETGAIRRLAAKAGLASLSPDGALLAYEDYARSGRLTGIRVEGGIPRRLAVGAGVRPIPSEARALAGVETPSGHVAVAPGARPISGRVPAWFVGLEAGRPVAAGEAFR